MYFPDNFSEVEEVEEALILEARKKSIQQAIQKDAEEYDLEPIHLGHNPYIVG